jgi:hypothetical protein
MEGKAYALGGLTRFTVPHFRNWSRSTDLIDQSCCLRPLSSRHPQTTSTAKTPHLLTLGRRDERAELHAAQLNALKTADTTAGTMPSSMKEGMKQSIIGSTLRTPTARART